MGDAFLDAEEVRFLARIPATKLGKGEKSGYYDDSDGCVPAGGAAASICGFGFGLRRTLAMIQRGTSQRRAKARKPQSCNHNNVQWHGRGVPMVREGRTKSIKGPDAIGDAFLLSKGILIEPTLCETVHEER